MGMILCLIMPIASKWRKPPNAGSFLVPQIKLTHFAETSFIPRIQSSSNPCLNPTDKAQGAFVKDRGAFHELNAPD